MLACCWLYLGLYDLYIEDESLRKTWAFVNDFDEGDPYHLYVFSFYWILETVTTVGYGDYTGSTLSEQVFSMFLEVSFNDSQTFLVHRPHLLLVLDGFH